MSDNLDELQRVVREGILRTVIGSMESGFLGRPGGTAETIPVRGRPGYVHVQRRRQSGIEALNKGNVPMVQDYPVEFRLENGTHVVYGKSVHPSMPLVEEPGVDTFLALSDTPIDYTGQAGKLVAVNATEDAVEFVAGGGGVGGNEFEWIHISAATFTEGHDGWGALVFDDDDHYWQMITILHGGSEYFGLARNYMFFNSRDNGSGQGAQLALGRNSNGSTPAAGHLRLTTLTGTGQNVWADAAGLLRIGTTTPLFAQDTSGVVVGDQSSSLAVKDVLGDPISPDEALLHVMAAARKAVKRFRYKPQVDGEAATRPYGGQAFSGVVVDYAPRYAQDEGKSLNTINAIGDLMLAVTGLAERVAELEAKLEANNGK